MALLFMDGFDHYDPGVDSEVAMKWDNTPSQSTLDSGGGRFGGNAIITKYYLTYLRKNFIGNPQTVILGFAWRGGGALTSGPSYPFICFGNADEYYHLAVEINSDGSISTKRYAGSDMGITAPGILTSDTWYYIEARAKASNTVGEVEVKVDGETVLNVSGEDTLYNSSIESWSSILISGTSSDSASNYLLFDDLY